MISQNIRLTASNVNLCIIKASSQTKNFIMLIKWASSLLCEMLHIEDGLSLMRILNHKYAVLLSLIKSVIILNDATTNIISPFDLILANKVL